MSIIAPQPKDDYKYIAPTGLYATTLTNCTAVLAYDATEDELAFDINATGDPTAVIELLYQIPTDFARFAGQSDDLKLKAIQDADSGDGVGDIAITVDVLDESGTDCDDDTINDIALTAAFVLLDCAMNAGSFAIGDHITIKITVTAKAGDAGEAGDGARVTIPKLKYIPN